nr:immunoglobulin heavy chain junction region [Macaca mulatta]
CVRDDYGSGLDNW